MLSKKQRAKNADWIETASKIEEIVSKDELDKLVKATVKEIKQKIKGKKAAYAWSGGKDSIVLSKICEAAGVTASMIGVCDLEYPAFMKWIEENKPEGCTIINTKQNLEWLAKHEEMLFPQDCAKASRWFSIVQHRAQQQYFKDNELDILILGRRRSDGNYVGNGDNIYTNGKGITRYSPLADWSHEHILAYIYYYKLSLPPIYDWKNGYTCGTHPWAARQWTGSIENGWQEVYEIDHTIVEHAAEYLQSAKTFIEEVAQCK